MLLVELFELAGLVVAELLAALERGEIERVDDAVVRERHPRRLARERLLVGLVLEVERVDRIALVARAVRAVAHVAPADAVDVGPQLVELDRGHRPAVLDARTALVDLPPAQPRSGVGAIDLDADLVAADVMHGDVARDPLAAVKAHLLALDLIPVAA